MNGARQLPVGEYHRRYCGGGGGGCGGPWTALISVEQTTAMTKVAAEATMRRAPVRRRTPYDPPGRKKLVSPWDYFIKLLQLRNYGIEKRGDCSFFGFYQLFLTNHRT